MANIKKSKGVGDYRHEEAKRVNNPPAGLAWQDTEKPTRRAYKYDAHRDPQLEWAGKAERTSFEVEAPSIHVHERLSTAAILSAVRKEQPQLGLFEDGELDRTKVIEFYQHRMDWANRLILGDSLVVMTSLLEKERLGGQVQMIYVDPPYGINYNSNFQARISNRTPKETEDETVTREPEQIQAYRDTWQLGVHSYLTYLRDRLLVCRDLLAQAGSIFVQIGPDRMHLVRTVLDEIFGASNACAIVTVAKTSQVTSKLLPEVADFLLWYAKDRRQVKYFQLFEQRSLLLEDDAYQYIELPDGTRRKMTATERANAQSLTSEGARIFRLGDATSQGYSAHKSVSFEFQGRTFHPGPNRHWLLRVEGMQGLDKANRLAVVGNTLAYVRYLEDFGVGRRTNIWMDTGQAGFAERKKAYVVETNPKIVERCVLMTTEPGDLVLDPTCGSGTTVWSCEKWGRRWITIDTSRVAVAIARERLLTAKFDYFRLKDSSVGVDAGLDYRTLKRVTASSIGYGEPAEEETLYDQPLVDGQKVRISGPFTVEALSPYAG
jgi:adenine-specific DNA-methyltransferase